MRYPFNGTYRLTQPFGVNPESYARFGLKGHSGLDFALPKGTPVRAAEDGTVITSAFDGPGFGNYIQVQGSYVTIYAHLDQSLVSKGKKVAAGEIIGYSGNTGNSTGPHLHLGVKPLNPDKNNGYFGAIDPMPLLKEADMPASQTIVDQEMVELSYQGVFKRNIDAAGLARVGKQSFSQMMRELNTSAENAEVVRLYNLGKQAIAEDWRGSMKRQLDIIDEQDDEIQKLSDKLQNALKAVTPPTTPAPVTEALTPSQDLIRAVGRFFKSLFSAVDKEEKK